MKRNKRRPRIRLHFFSGEGSCITPTSPPSITRPHQSPSVSVADSFVSETASDSRHGYTQSENRRKSEIIDTHGSGGARVVGTPRPVQSCSRKGFTHSSDWLLYYTVDENAEICPLGDGAIRSVGCTTHVRTAAVVRNVMLLNTTGTVLMKKEIFHKW